MEKRLPSERDAETSFTKATKAEYAKQYDQALRFYVKAAESYLHLSRSTPGTEKTKQQWKVNAAKSLERAEKIKKFVETPRQQPKTSNQTSNPNVYLTPIGINHFSPQEQFYVLKKGSKVNNIFFPIWDDSTPTGKPSTLAYSDPDGQPTLSPEQEEVSPVWRRPTYPTISKSSAIGGKILPQQILQHIVTDCSVCASISVCLEHGRRFESSLESTIRHSFEQTNWKDGQYDIRMLFNGTWRRIAIDDKLLFHPTEGTLMCMSVIPLSSTSTLRDTSVSQVDILWPSLLEKAYMKLKGGYDFPGSNSSTDLHALAGWIPEYIDLKGSTFEREKTWERIEMGFSSGKCVVTLGTGPTPNPQWRTTPLLPSHSYAVIDAYETAVEGRIFSVLDSWEQPTEDQAHSSRELQIPWAEVLNTFNGVFLSWDPKLWTNSLIFHGMWKRNTADVEGTRYLQIEFQCTSTSTEEIWILLTRHVADTHKTSDFAALRVELEDNFVHDTSLVENQRILSSKGTYTNDIHILVRQRIPTSQRSGILSIAASYDGDSREVGFTVTAYAGERTKISWIENQTDPPHTTTIEGAFTSKTAGGNCTYPTFMINPQYELTIHPATQLGKKAKVALNLQTNRDTPINVAMVWSQNQRVSELCENDLVATSGAYNYGLARTTKNVTIGTYVIVASAFEPHYMGPFSLKIDSSHPFDLKPIPQEGAGMYCKVIRGAWDTETAAGAPSFSNYSKNPIIEVVVPANTQMRVRLQRLESSSAIAINVTVYVNQNDDIASSLKQQHITTSGAYDDSIAGVSTPQFTLSAGKYYIVPSTYNPGATTGFRMLVYSSISTIKVGHR